MPFPATCVRPDTARRYPLLLVALLVMPVCAVHGQAPPWGEEQRLTANDAVPTIGFGDSVELGDGIALVGATANGTANVSAGAVYVLRWDETDGRWHHAQKLTADDGELDDRFGWSLSLSGDVAIVGAPDDSTEAGENAGAAYIFRRTGDVWAQEQKLTADDAAEGARFGRSVAVSDTVAIVGAPEAEGGGWPMGAAYVYHWDGAAWYQAQKIQVGTFATIADFGAAVDADGDRLLIGVPDAGEGAQNLGAAFVFRWDPEEAMWAEEQRLAASDEDPQDKFGSSVDLSGDVALIGVPQDSDGGAFAGAAYIFRWNEGSESWEEEQRLTADDAAEGDGFGAAVALDGDVAVVGAPNDDHDAGSGAGAGYLFIWNGTAWVQEKKLTGSNPGIGDHFGESVAAYGDRLLLGASNYDENGESTGAAYVFRMDAITGTAVEGDPLPAGFVLLDAYPNPFDGQATLSYRLPRAGRVHLAVYDVLGRLVAELEDRAMPAGAHAVPFEAGALAPGLYIARLETEDGVHTRRMVYIR